MTSLSSHTVSNRLTFLHPISLLSDNSNTLPIDMALESRDCLSLYRALYSHSLVKNDSLSPNTFFKGRDLLCQKDILEYEKDLKDVVVHSMTHNPSSLKKLISSLTPYDLTKPEVDVPPSKEKFLEGLLTLVCDLHKLENLVSSSFISHIVQYSERFSQLSFSPSIERTANSLPNFLLRDSNRRRKSGSELAVNGRLNLRKLRIGGKWTRFGLLDVRKK